jgi:enoyl-CoA hydratase/carnithine racemase
MQLARNLELYGILSCYKTSHCLFIDSDSNEANMSADLTINIATGGEIKITTPAPSVYLLSFASPPDNRLTTALIDSWLLALDIIEQRFPAGVVITTSSIQKFFSNGLDLAHVADTPDFMPKYLYALFQRLLLFPMPTIALLNGHAFAAGFMVAMYHDYRVMNPAKGFLCLNEVVFGAVMPAGMVSVFRQKLPNPQTFRELILEGKRVAAPEALASGIVDHLGGLDEALALIRGRNLASMGASGVYGKLKREMWRESAALLRGHAGDVVYYNQLDKEEEQSKKEAQAKVASWENQRDAAKL